MGDVIEIKDKFLSLFDLFGKEYTPVKISSYYTILGSLYNEVVINYSHISTDLRISQFVPIGPGRGKDEISTVIKRSYLCYGGGYSEPISYHAEDLIGKVVPTQVGKGTIRYDTIPGYFNEEYLIFNEATDLLMDPKHENSRKYMRKALDEYGKNEIMKKGVNVPKEHMMTYFPKTVLTLFFQPFPVPAVNIMTGLFRRVMIPYIEVKPSHKALYFRISNEENTGRLSPYWSDWFSFLLTAKNHLQALKKSGISLEKDIEITNDEAQYISQCVVDIIDRSYKRQPITHDYIESCRFVIQNWLFKMSTINALSRNSLKVIDEDVKEAFTDLKTVWDCQMDFVESWIDWKGYKSVNLRGQREQQILTWLSSQGYSEDNPIERGSLIIWIMENYKVSEPRAIQLINDLITDNYIYKLKTDEDKRKVFYGVDTKK